MLRKITIFTSVILCLMLLNASHLYSASNGTIKGTVFDAATEEPLPFASIFLVGTSLGDAADKSGNFNIKQVPPGKYSLRVTFIGYKTYEEAVTVEEGKTLTLKVSLNPESILNETVIVTAQAEGQMNAINEQLTSLAIKNVVSAARIQELPDANAAESVSRLPGVSLMRTGGEGSKVVIRGLSPQYNRVTIDGVELPSNATSNDPNEHRTEMGRGDQLSLSGDRATDLSMISSNMLGGIEVIKAITPDMDATVLGGVINFSMRKAETASYIAPRFEIVTQGSFNDLKDTYNDYKGVASYEQRFFGNSFGIFLQGTAEKKNLSGNDLNANYYFSGKLNITDEGAPEFQSLSLTDVFRKRDRYGATLVLDYIYDNGSIGFMNFFSRSKTRAQSRNESYQLLADDMYFSATNATTDLDVYSNLLSIKHVIEEVGIDIKLSHSFSGSENPEDVNFNFWQNGCGFENKYSALKYLSAKEIASYVVRNPEEAVFFNISNIGNKSMDRTYNGSIDIYRDFTFNDLLTTKIKIGGAYNYRDRSYDYNQSSGSVFYDDGGQVTAQILREYPQFGTEVTFSDFIDPNYNYGDFLNGDYTLGSPGNVDLMLDIIEFAKQHPGAGNGGGYKPHKLASILYDYSGHEVRSAGYAIATVNIGTMVTVVPGVRYQNLTTTYSGVQGMQTSGELQYSIAEATKSHGYWLPMLHFRFKPNDWLQFHFAYTNTLNYPDYNTIIPRFYVGSNYIIYNNSSLKPAESENFDAMISLYANEIGLFSLGGFKKNITNLIFPSTTYPKDFSAYPDLYEIVKNKKEAMSLNTYINSPISIDVLGIETEWQTNFWYLPEPLAGLVLNVNYTHIFSEAKYPKTYLISYLDSNWVQQTTAIDTIYATRLLNQPNDIFNISLGYDYAGFSMRISMLYQDNIFKRPDFWLQNRIHSDKYVRFDLSVKQELPWFGIQVYLNLNNISGEDDVDINQKTTFVTMQQRYGMTADMGLRVKF
ncbi:MAG: TonB-dependent receptor [bacterium]